MKLINKEKSCFHTAQVHSLVLLAVGPLQVILQNLGSANNDVIPLNCLCEGDFELRVSADSFHFVLRLQKGQELGGVMLLHEGDLQGTRAQ